MEQKQILAEVISKIATEEVALLAQLAPIQKLGAGSPDILLRDALAGIGDEQIQSINGIFSGSPAPPKHRRQETAAALHLGSRHFGQCQKTEAPKEQWKVQWRWREI